MSININRSFGAVLICFHSNMIMFVEYKYCDHAVTLWRLGNTKSYTSPNKYFNKCVILANDM